MSVLPSAFRRAAEQASDPVNYGKPTLEDFARREVVAAADLQFNEPPEGHQLGARKLPPLPFKGADPLDEIASTMRELTYGEMIDLAAAVWAARGEDEFTEALLPAILHRWCTKHGE